MKNLIKRLRLAYILYNLLHKKELIYNEVIYKKLGLKKKFYSSISSKDFAKLSYTTPHDININKQQLESSILFNILSEEDQKSLHSFNENGFSIIRNYLSLEQVDKINNEIAALLLKGKLKSYKNKFFGAIHYSNSMKDIANDEKLKEVLSILLGQNCLLFGSMNFITGTEMASHSDSIHMTTYPLGGMIVVWIALDEITEVNGPLHYYPGSHKLPYYLNSDYNNEGNFFLIGNKSYKVYENMINNKIKEQCLTKEIFKANKGDLMIWHANLIHGGEPHLDKSKSRKSMVFHYYGENSICYHEITQRPALRWMFY
jgi:phytanoyl-CoA hydroxylase